MRRFQTTGEEIANSISHGCGALAALAAVPILLANGLSTGKPGLELFALTIFGGTLAAMYLSSTLYHALPLGGAKRVFRILDHSAIYLLIAGTYTPFALGVFKAAWGWAMFTLIWALAGLGVLLKSRGQLAHPVISSGLYLLMGWLALASADPLLSVLPPAGLAWVLAGGIAYSLGVVFFVLDRRIRYAHFVWHLFVLAGSLCHFVAVLGYA